MSGGGADRAWAGALLVNRSLLGMLFAPTKNKKLHDILTCSTYVVDPSRLLGSWLRFSVFFKGKGVQFICFGQFRSSGWMGPAEADWDCEHCHTMYTTTIRCGGIEWIWMDVVEEKL